MNKYFGNYMLRIWWGIQFNAQIYQCADNNDINDNNGGMIKRVMMKMIVAIIEIIKIAMITYYM